MFYRKQFREGETFYSIGHRPAKPYWKATALMLCVAEWGWQVTLRIMGRQIFLFTRKGTR